MAPSMAMCRGALPRTPLLRVQVLAGHFTGTSVPISPTYKVNIQRLEPGVRESIRDVDGLPTNCDMCKPWIGDIAAAAAQQGKPAYRWHAPSAPPAFASLPKPLAECKVGLVGTAGCYVVGDTAHYHKEDSSIKAISSSTSVKDLRFSHVTENYLTDARRDPNCVFPLDTLRQLVADQVVGSIADTVFSCMGANYSRKTTSEKIAPNMLVALQAEKVDVALIVPL